MMTSINPKNVNLNNLQLNEGDNMPSTTNNLFEKYNFGIEKEAINEGIGNNIKYKTNANINFNMNDNNYNQPQFNSYKSLKNPDKINENMMKNINDYTKLNNDYTKLTTNNNSISNNLNNLNLKYTNQNNSINLNLGLQAKKNYSTPILNETGPGSNQEMNYNKSFDMYDRNQQNKNLLNYGQPQNLGQNKNAGNNEYYLAEIEKLKKEINNLKKDNEYLTTQLKEEQKKSEQLFSMQKAKDEGENSILSEISHCLQVSSFEEILPKLNEIINYLNNNVSNANKDNKQDSENKIRDELISKLQNLYLSLTGSSEKKEEITIKILWRWIKHLINTVKQLALEKEKNIEMYQNIQEIGDYKDYCEELISEFNLQSLDELKMFIDNLLKQNNISIMKGNENNQELGNPPMTRQNPMIQQQFQVQNYQQDEENDDGEGEPEGEAEGEAEGEVEMEGEMEGEVEGEGEGEGEEEGDDNVDPNQQQYENENENEYDENNEMMQQQMEINNQNNQMEGNYNFKYEGNPNQGNEY